MRIGFVGAGSMGGAIMTGLIESGAVDKSNVYVRVSSDERTKQCADRNGVNPMSTIAELTRVSDIVFIGVEPNVAPKVLDEIKQAYDPRQIVISMAAGVTIAEIENIIGKNAKVIRIMPNTPAAIGEIMTSVSPNMNVAEDEAAAVIDLFSQMGGAVYLPEDAIHGVIGVSGSSPAYTYLYIKGLCKCADQEGIPADKARFMACKAVIGAAKLALLSDESLDDLINKVCTPGGTTFAAVNFLKEQHFIEMVLGAAEAAVHRSKEMSEK